MMTAYRSLSGSAWVCLLLALQTSSCSADGALSYSDSQMMTPRAGSCMPALARARSNWDFEAAINCTLTPGVLTAPLKPAPGAALHTTVKEEGAVAGAQSLTTSQTENQNDVKNIEESLHRLKLGDKPASEQREKNKSFACRAEDKAVDWFIVLKQDKSYEYVYVSSLNDTVWKVGTDVTKNGPVFETRNQSRKGVVVAAEYSYTSENSGANQGHQNGDILFGDDTGFWLMHSWPTISGSDQNPNMSKGQSFICITCWKAELENIAGQFNISKPNFSVERPPLHVPTRGNASPKVVKLRSIDGRLFIHFARPKASNKYLIDMYDWIALSYNKSLLVQSWKHSTSETWGWRNLIENGQIYVTDVVSTKLYKWALMSRSNNHSKWCIADLKSDAEDKLYLVCIGDLNRPHNRSGGALCMENENVWKLFRAVARQYNTSEGHVKELPEY